MSKNNKSNSNYLFQGVILGSASIIVRIIGLIYRIPLGRIIGDVGNSYYSCAYEVYSLILIVSSYSMPLAVSKIVSARIGMGQKENVNRILKCALVLGLTVGAIGALFAYFGADFLTGTLLNTPEGAICLRVLAPCILIVAVLGVIRGYFQGLGTMIPTAASQIIEQIVNAVVAIAAATYLFSFGLKVDAVLGTETAAPAYGASGSTLGTTLGALSALVFVTVLLMAYLKKSKKEITFENTEKLESYGSILSVLAMTILPVIFSTAIYNVNGILDQGIFKSVMQKVGHGKEDIDVLWGIYSGKFKVLSNVPVALASAMASSTIPNISKQVGNRKAVRKSVGDVIRFTMVISIPCAVGLSVFGAEIMEVLWPGTPKVASQMMFWGSCSVIFYSLSTLTNGILQGIDKMRLPVIHAAISLGVHLVLLYVLIAVFRMEGMAIVHSYTFFGIMMCILNALAIRKHLRYRQEIRRTFIVPIFSAAVMGVVSRVVYNVLYSVMGRTSVAMLIALVFAIIIAVVVYFLALLAMRGLRERELRAFPKGHVLVKVAKKLHFKL